MVRRALGLAIFAAACTGSVDNSTCDSAPPATPSVIEPLAGRIDVTTESLAITSSTYSDAEGEAHARSEFEIWIVAGSDRVERVWLASVSDPAKLTGVVASDGAFEGRAGPTGRLDDWTAYVARVRYQDSCGAWSAWSDDRVFVTDDGSTWLFDPAVVRDVHLEIPPDSFAAIDAQAVGPWPYVPDRDYHTGTLTFEGVTYPGVGIRVKGGCGSSRDLSGKAAFKVSLDWDDPAIAGCPENRRLFGQKHLTLNNMVQDRSFERERLGYRLFRAFGVPAPRAAHVRLFVNGEDWGLYLHLESFDRRFLDRWFPSNDGMMYEGGPFCDVVPSQIPPGPGEQCFDMEFSTDVCDPLQPGQDPTDWELLRQLANQIEALPAGAFYPGVDAFFDYDEFLSSWAVGAVISNWDGYQYGNVNNYRMYHDPSTGLWSLLQAGIDNTFDSSPGFDFWGVTGVLAARCLQEPACTAAFAAKVHAANDLFESLDLATEAEAIQAQIGPEIQTDPRKEISNAEAMGAHLSLVSWIRARPQAVRDSLATRGF